MMAVDVLDGPSFAIGEPEMLFADVYDNSGVFNYAAFPGMSRPLLKLGGGSAEILRDVRH